MGFVNRIKRVAFGVIEAPFNNRQKAVLADRANYSKENFIDFFDTSDNVPEIVWNIFQKEIVLDGFKPQPEDDIAYMFGIVDEDLRDLILEALSNCHKLLPDEEQLGKMKPIKTIENLVNFISICSYGNNG